MIKFLIARCASFGILALTLGMLSGRNLQAQSSDNKVVLDGVIIGDIEGSSSGDCGLQSGTEVESSSELTWGKTSQMLADAPSPAPTPGCKAKSGYTRATKAPSENPVQSSLWNARDPQSTSAGWTPQTTALKQLLDEFGISPTGLCSPSTCPKSLTCYPDGLINDGTDGVDFSIFVSTTGFDPPHDVAKRYVAKIKDSSKTAGFTASSCSCKKLPGSD